MPIVPKITAVGACALYAMREVLPELFSGYHVLGFHSHDYPDVALGARTVHAEVVLPSSHEARVDTVLLKRPNDKEHNTGIDDRFYPCIMRVRVDSEKVVVHLLRLYFDAEVDRVDVAPTIVGYRFLSRIEECSRSSLVDMHYSLEKHAKTVLFEAECSPPPAY